MRESAAAIWLVGSLNSLRDFPNSAAVEFEHVGDAP
jgi:hypothetical protein